MAERLQLIVQAVDKASRTLKEIEKNTKKLNVVSIAAFTNLAKTATEAVQKINRTLGELTSMAAETESLQLSFQTLSQEAGTTADKLLSELKRTSKGTISDLELMKNANTAFILLGKDVAREFPKLMEIARAASLATGQSLEFMFQSIVTGIGRQSRMILDNLGIIVKIEDANKAYADQLGVTSESLTDVQKRTAFFNATMKAGQSIISRVGERTLTSKEMFEKFDATMKNLKVTIGQSLLPAATSLAETLQGLAIQTQKFVENNRKLVDSLITLAQVVVVGGSLALGMKALQVAYLGITIGAGKAAIATAAFYKVVAKHPYVAIATALVAVTAAVTFYIDSLIEADIEQNKSNDSLQGRIDLLEKEKTRIAELIKTEGLSGEALKRQQEKLTNVFRAQALFRQKIIEKQSEAAFQAAQEASEKITDEQKKAQEERLALVDSEIEKTKEARALAGREGLALLVAQQALDMEKLREKFLVEGEITIEGEIALAEIRARHRIARDALKLESDEKERKATVKLRADLLLIEADKTTDLRAQFELRNQSLKEMLTAGLITTQQFQLREARLTASFQKSQQQQRQKAADKSFELATRLGDVLKTDQRDRGNAFKALLQEQLRDQIKTRVSAAIKELFIVSTLEQSKATLGGFLSFGATLFAIPLIVGATAAAESLLNSVKFAQGGVVEGGVPSRDSVVGSLKPGEGILTTDAVDRLNRGEGVGGGVTIIVKVDNFFGTRQGGEMLAEIITRHVRDEGGLVLASRVIG